MASKKTAIIKLEVSEVSIPPRPRAVPRREVVPRIEVIKMESIQSECVPEVLHTKMLKQRLVKPHEIIRTSVPIPSIAPLHIPTRTLPETPQKPETVEETHIRVIRPTNRNEAEQIIKEAFEEINVDVLAVLTYTDESTFAYLDNIPKSVGIRILTSVIDNESLTKRAAELQRRSRKDLQVVKLTFTENNEEKSLLHERWLSDGITFIDFGTDLKTRALGAKQHTIIIDPAHRHRSQLENFEWYWNSDEEKLTLTFNKKVSKKVFFPSKG
jgi:hypothetical protein